VLSRDPGSHLLAQLSFGVTTCFKPPDLASLLRWASALSRAL
jgi:hypothetical protein